MTQYPHTWPVRQDGAHAPRARPRHRDRHAADRPHQLGARRRGSRPRSRHDHARDRACTGVDAASCSPRTPTRGRWWPAARCSTALGDVHRLPDPPGVGLPRDPGLADLDDAAGAGLRLRVRARARRGTRRSPTTSASRWWPSATTPSSTTCRRMWVTADDVREAHDAALASRRLVEPPEEGSVGGGTGMSCLGFKGGIGTSSRVTPDGHTVARGADDQLRRAGPAHRRRRARRPAAARGARRPRSRPARASAWWSPTPRSTRPGANGWLAGSGSASPAPARPRTTAAARSSWPSAPPPAPTATAPCSTTGSGSAAGRSTTSSRRSSTRPRSRCSTRC